MKNDSFLQFKHFSGPNTRRSNEESRNTMLRSLVFVSLIGLHWAQVVALSGPKVNTSNYTIINGQIFTPGLAIVDAPQPNTPLGGG
jgi:hypothetical protein